MVTSGLIDKVDVSHYRLSIHLFIAFVILSCLIWYFLNHIKDLDKKFFTGKSKLFSIKIFIFLIFLQIILGVLLLNATFLLRLCRHVLLRRHDLFRDAAGAAAPRWGPAGGSTPFSSAPQKAGPARGPAGNPRSHSASAISHSHVSGGLTLDRRGSGSQAINIDISTRFRLLLAAA